VSGLEDKIKPRGKGSEEMTDFSFRQQKRYLVVVDWVGHSAVAGESEAAVAVVGLVAAGRKWIGGGRTRSLRTPSTAVSVGGDGEFVRPCPDLLGPTSPHNRDHGISPGTVC